MSWNPWQQWHWRSPLFEAALLDTNWPLSSLNATNNCPGIQALPLYQWSRKIPLLNPPTIRGQLVDGALFGEMTRTKNSEGIDFRPPKQ
jgi:hypothetical protein